MTRRRVVVTGLGIVSPVGSSVALAWDNILKGKSGIRPIDTYDVSTFSTRFAGLVSSDFKAEDWMGPKEIRKTDPFIHYGVAAARQALKDSGIEVNDSTRDRIGILVGSGIGGIGSIEEQCVALNTKGVKRVSPLVLSATHCSSIEPMPPMP